MIWWSHELPNSRKLDSPAILFFVSCYIFVYAADNTSVIFLKQFWEQKFTSKYFCLKLSNFVSIGSFFIHSLKKIKELFQPQWFTHVCTKAVGQLFCFFKLQWAGKANHVWNSKNANTTGYHHMLQYFTTQVEYQGSVPLGITWGELCNYSEQ